MNNYTPEELEIIINEAQARYMVAVLLLLGMALMVIASLAFALGWRKTAAFFMTGYGAVTTFVGVGFAGYFGPAIAVFGIAALVREWVFSENKKATPKQVAQIAT